MVFIEWTKSVWTFPAVSARSIGHPAPFPEELKDGRHYIGYDIEEKYVELANQRIKHFTGQKTLFENELPSLSVTSNEKLSREVVNSIEL